MRETRKNKEALGACARQWGIAYWEPEYDMWNKDGIQVTEKSLVSANILSSSLLDFDHNIATLLIRDCLHIFSAFSRQRRGVGLKSFLKNCAASSQCSWHANLCLIVVLFCYTEKLFSVGFEQWAVARCECGFGWWWSEKENMGGISECRRLLCRGCV